MYSNHVIKKAEKLVREVKQNSIIIYDNILAIEAEKGDDSLWPNELFRHDFKDNKGRAKVYGLPDGSLLITGNKTLWEMFDYD